MGDGETAKSASAGWCQIHEDLAPVVAALPRGDHAAVLHATHKLLGRVVGELKALRELTDGRLAPSGEPADREEELVLLRLQSRFPRGSFREVQKATDPVAKLRERAVVVAGKVRDGRHAFVS